MESKSYKDYYYILGVSPEATTQEIRRAYADLGTKFGPQAPMGAHDAGMMLKTYKDMTEAYECLTDPARRKQYDEANLPHLQKTHLRQLWTKLTGVDTTSQSIASTQQGQARTEPTETRMEVEVTLREAMKGSTKQLRINDQAPCTQCVHLKPIERRGCAGCRGTGYIAHERLEDFPLPAGMHDHMEIRFRGRGKYDLRVGAAGDLVVEVRLREHSYFTLAGRDICCTVPITLFEAVLGAEIEVPTATGRVLMNVRPLTQHGRVYRLKGLGLSGADLLVTVEIELPTQISGEEVALFRKLKDMNNQGNPRAEIFTKLSQGP